MGRVLLLVNTGLVEAAGHLQEVEQASLELVAQGEQVQRLQSPVHPFITLVVVVDLRELEGQLPLVMVELEEEELPVRLDRLAPRALFLKSRGRRVVQGQREQRPK